MINLRKCKFLVTNAPILGLDLCKAGFALGLKYMGNLHKVGIPEDLRGLQSLLGRLMYASAHVPHYKQRVSAIEKLLSQKGEVRWTRECTEALNDLLNCVWNRVRLVQADPHGMLQLYPSVSEGFGFVACL